MNGITLGSTCVDRLTKFRGTVTGIVNYLTGCNQALLTPELGPDGGYREPHWFDLERLDVDTSIAVATLRAGNAGFDKAAPIR